MIAFPARLFAVTVFVAVLIPGIASALPSGGSLYLSIPNSSVKCANIVLPDDGGYFGKGTVEYEITMSPDPYETWSDLSHQTVSTDENNTVILPICFSTYNRPLGNCSKPFTIRITAPSVGVDRSWDGGVCASRYADFDTNHGPSDGAGSGDGTHGATASSLEGLDSADVFSLGFVQPIIQSGVSDVASFVLRVQSEADIGIELSVSAASDLYVTPSSVSVSTSDASYQEIPFNVTAPSYTGDFPFTVNARISGCGSSSACRKQATARLQAGGDSTDTTGFSATIFPENINVRDLQPVSYRLTVTNLGEDDEFTFSASLPDGVSSTFSESTFTVPSGGSRTMSFEVTPESINSAYDLDFSVESSGGNNKPLTAYLSTNELLTDSLRITDVIDRSGDRQASQRARSQLDSWYQTYSDSAYGDNLEQYSELQSGLHDARDDASAQDAVEDPGAQDNNDSGTDGGTADSGDYLPRPGTGLELFGKDIWIIMVIAAAGLGAAFVFARKRESGQKDEMDKEIEF